ncbi:unnamed protein product, partial [Prorocentrum cordatum]
AVHGAGQAALLWAARGECPACTCAPALTCAPGQEVARLDCPGGPPGWALSAVALAGVTGFAGGLLAARSAAAAAASGHPLALEGLDEGDFIHVLYRVGGARIWHERLILAFQTVPPFGTGIMTPDGHACVEAIMQNGADIREYAVPAGASAGAVAATSAGDQVYRFRGLPLPGDVATGAASVRGTLGLGAGPPIALNTAGRVIAAAVGVPRRQRQHLRQEVLQLARLLAEEGRPQPLQALSAAPPWPRLHLGPPPPLRLLWAVALALVEWPQHWLPSPALLEATLGFSRWLSTRRGRGTWTFELQRFAYTRTKWASEGYLEADDPGVDTHLLRCRLLELGVVYDQLHVTNIAAMELVGRTLQTQEELYRDRFAAASEFGSDAALMSGALDAGGNACAAPALRDWLAAEKAREANIAKERRKAREERFLAAGGSSGGGGGSDGVRLQPQALARVEDFVTATSSRCRSPLVLLAHPQRQAIMHISDSIDELGRPPSEFMSGTAAEDGALRDGQLGVNVVKNSAVGVAAYVDNILVFGGSQSLVDQTMARLVSTFRSDDSWGYSVEHLGSSGTRALKNPEDIQEANTLGVYGMDLGVPVELNMTKALRISTDPWELDEVPGHITRKEAWKSVSAQSVSLGANILYLEGEALVTSAEAMPRRGSRTPSASTRHRARLAAMAAGGRTSTLAMSLLEQLAVRPNTEAFWQLLHSFVSYCADHHLDWSTLCQLDSILAEYFTARYLEGAAANVGPQTIAAISHFTPGLPRQMGTELPRASRAMQAWKRRTPALTRLPIPRAVMFALCGMLIAWQQPQMAAWLAISFSAYLRPAEAQRLTTDSIVQPSIGAGAAHQFWGLLLHPADRGQGGKTGSFDESILFDLDLYLVPVLMALRLKGPAATPLWGFSLGQLNQMFTLAATALGINHLRPHLYGMRHGGVSDDLLTQRRSMEQVFRRGRWAVMSSTRRCAKETALLRELQGAAEDVYALGHLVEGRFCELLEMGFIKSGCLAQVPSRLAEAMQLGAPARGRRVVLELFSGSGHLTAAVRRLGLSGLGLDIRQGPLEDHLDATFEEAQRPFLDEPNADMTAAAAQWGAARDRVSCVAPRFNPEELDAQMVREIGGDVRSMAT